MTNSFDFKRISNANINDLAYLMNCVHENVPDVSYFRNKLDTQYTGISNIGYLAYSSEGEPAAFYGVYPTVLFNGKARIIAAQSGDTITHPKFQRQGLFVELATMTYELAREEGVDVIFGFPNKNSAHGFFTKLNWQKTSNFQQASRQYKNTNLYNLLNKYAFTRPIYRLYFNLIKSIHKSNKIKNPPWINDTFFTERSTNYYDYKLKNRTSFLITIDTFTFWIKFDDGLILGDVDPFEVGPESKKRFHEALKKLAFRTGAKKVTAYFQTGSTLFSLFELEEIQELELFSGYLTLKGPSDSKIRYSFADSDTF